MIRLAKQKDNRTHIYLSNGKKLQHKGKLINYTDSTAAIDENGKLMCTMKTAKMFLVILQKQILLKMICP